MKTIVNITYPAFALFALVCFALSPQARAVCQQGCGANQNTALGDAALASFTVGYGNTAVGYYALSSSTSIYNNTAVGYNALMSNTAGSSGVAVGSGALQANTIGWENVAVGYSALTANIDGQNNTAVGHTALYENALGNNNTALGSQSLLLNTTGDNNIAIGYQAAQNLTTGSGNIEIGHSGVAGEAAHIRIGTQGKQTATFIAGIRGTPITGGIPVGVNSSGQLGVAPSSQRFKQNIQPMDKASEAILSLRPVTFRYKHELDPDGIPQFGLVAEDVEKVNSNLVARDDQGKPYTVRYDAVNAMLLNEFLKEHRTVQEQQKEIDVLKTELKEQRTLIQKVSARLEVSNPAPQTALNDQ
jgi:hypothetical protein